MIRNTIIVCLIAFVLIFVVQNSQVVEFQSLVWMLSRALMLFGALAIGFVAGLLLKVPKQKRATRAKQKIEIES